MDNAETGTTLGTRHSPEKNKTKQSKSKNNENNTEIVPCFQHGGFKSSVVRINLHFLMIVNQIQREIWEDM